MRDSLPKFLAIVGNRAARSAERERRPNHQRKSQLIAKSQRILRVIHQRRRRHFQANLATSVFEPQAVFRNLIALSDTPIISTLYFSRIPLSLNSTARFSAVCPPTVGNNASGFSFAIISSRYSLVRGSI